MIIGKSGINSINEELSFAVLFVVVLCLCTLAFSHEKHLIFPTGFTLPFMNRGNKHNKEHDITLPLATHVITRYSWIEEYTVCEMVIG